MGRPARGKLLNHARNESCGGRDVTGVKLGTEKNRFFVVVFLGFFLIPDVAFLPVHKIMMGF